MKVISIVNQKGGCGKTTTAVNLSAALSKKEFNVLLIDLDPQGHSTFSLRHSHREGTPKPPPTEHTVTITDIFEDICQQQHLAREGTWNSLTQHFSFIPSSIGLASIEHKLSDQSDRLGILTSFLNEKAHSFDYVILDCPPNLGILTLNALVASHYALIPLMACDFSLKGVEILKNIMIMVKEYKGCVPAPFHFLTRVDKRSRFTRNFIAKVKKLLGNLLLDTTIRTNVHLREAASEGKHIFEYMPHSRGALDYITLAEEIETITQKMNWMPLFLKGKNLGEVYAVGDFSKWQKDENYKLKKTGEDIWAINLPLQKGKYRYKFFAGGKWFSDPHNKASENDPFGGKNSLMVIS